MTTHVLKCWPTPFDQVRCGKKTHEVRRNDRNYSVNDCLILRKFDPDTSQFTGDELAVVITHITSGGTFGLPHDVCVMSVAL